MQVKFQAPSLAADERACALGPTPATPRKRANRRPADGHALDPAPVPRSAPVPVLGRAAPPRTEAKRRAAATVGKAFRRIAADFSEAYEHCRNDAQRRALEGAHCRAREADLRAREEALSHDGGGWRRLESDFRLERARAERDLARLATAGAVMRILKRIAEIEAQLAVLAA